MLTEKEFYSVAAKHPNVRAAFDKAIDTMTKMAREAKRPGLWAKVRVTGAAFENASAMSELLKVYGTATGCRRPVSDVDCIEKIVFMAAKNPDRAFEIMLATMCGAVT